MDTRDVVQQTGFIPKKESILEEKNLLRNKNQFSETYSCSFLLIPTTPPKISLICSRGSNRILQNLRSCSNSCCRYGLLQPSPLVVAGWIEFICAASLPTGLRIGTSSRNIPPPAVPLSLSLPTSARFTPMIRIWWEREECLLPI